MATKPRPKAITKPIILGMIAEALRSVEARRKTMAWFTPYLTRET
ncbi:hypothetical protein [Phenylobacterium sp.]